MDFFFTHSGLRGSHEPDAVCAREHRARATMPSDSQSRATHTANLGVIECAADASARKTISSMESFAAAAWVRRPSRNQREGRLKGHSKRSIDQSLVAH